MGGFQLRFIFTKSLANNYDKKNKIKATKVGAKGISLKGKAKNKNAARILRKKL